MPVDPQIQELLDKGTGVPATHTLPVEVARAQYEARIALMAPAAEIAGVREQTIDGPGGPLRIRIYTPHGTGPFPLVVFFQGSGFVLCSLDTHDGMCRNLCGGAGCVLASVDYRLAPSTSSRLRSRILCTRRAGRPCMPLSWAQTPRWFSSQVFPFCTPQFLPKEHKNRGGRCNRPGSRI